MAARQWQLQDAKTQFSQVVDAALRGEPQHVTRRGKQAVVVVAEATFDALQRSAQASAPGLIAHLLAMPRAGRTEFEPATLVLRDVVFK